MSFNSHRRALLDETRPLAHRTSHARSCVLHLSNKLEIKREAAIQLILEMTGVDLDQPEDGAALIKALAAMEALRQKP